MADIQKSMKTMGKAMTQLGEGADFDDDLFEEQSHAQVSAYSYATRKTVSMHDQLLDNQSSVPKFVTNIRSSESPMVLKSNGGTLPINKVANFEGFEIETWFSSNAMTNVLSFLLVKSESLMTVMLSSSIGQQRASLIWWLSPTQAGCMCMTRKMPEDWQVTPSWRQLRVT
jgi:hypothetical protein